MNLIKVPSICKDAVCIAGDPLIGAQISSYFNLDDEYFVLIEPPRMKRSDYTNEIIRRSNVVSRLKPKFTILAGLEEEALSKFQNIFHPRETIILNLGDNIDDKLSPIRNFTFKTEIFCRTEDICLGLLIAKNLKARLNIDDTAHPIEQQFPYFSLKSKHYIILDDHTEIAPIISANYAFSLSANLTFFPQISDDIVEKVYDNLQCRTSLGDLPRGKIAKIEIDELSAELYKLKKSLKDAEFTTYITLGLPYGYFFIDIPSTHLFSKPDLGISIFNCLYFNSNISITRSAVVLDPGYFEDSETKLIMDKLGSSGVGSILLSGEEVDGLLVGNYFEYFPYDLFFICSHGGEIPGKRLTIKFNDRNENSHTIVIDHAMDFSFTGEGEGDQEKVALKKFTGFVELDGIAFRSEESKSTNDTSYVLEDFFKISEGDWEVLESHDVSYVKNCNTIKLKNGLCMLGFHCVGGEEFPIIINNSCVSFYGWGLASMFGGARGYIGTLTNVDTIVAKQLAENLFLNFSERKPLPLLLWEIQNEIISNPNDRVYIHLGCHFNSIKFPMADTTETVKKLLSIYIERWKDTLNEIENDELVQNRNRIIKFLESIEL